MTHQRDAVLNTFWRGHDPFVGFPTGMFERDTQGWAGTHHHYLSEAVVALRPKVIVEVGVWKGGSTIEMASTLRHEGIDGVVIAVDTWLGSWDHWISDDLQHLGLDHGYPSIQRKFMNNVISHRLTDYVLPLPLDSVNAANVLRHYKIRPDIVHIDAGHDYRAVMTDLEEWWPQIADGGLLIGDDYFQDSTWPDVKKAFDAFFTNEGLFPFDFEPGKCRIQKPAALP